MATYRKRGERWRVELCVNGSRDGGTFATKAEAREWAARREVELRASGAGRSLTYTVDDLFDRYARDVSPKKRGSRWELLRLRTIADAVVDSGRLGGMRLCDVTAVQIAQYRDLRLHTVAGSTVNRELNLLSHVFSVARDEWHWLDSSPTTRVARPRESAPRDRRITDAEIERLCYALGFVDGLPVESVSQRVAVAFLFAIETAMRCGEICGLQVEHVTGPVALLPLTKNGSARRVPLSLRALELLSSLPDGENRVGVFDLKTSQIDALFRKARRSAGIEGLTFHDTRHEAITRLAQKLTPLELARMIGHRDLKMLMVYYNETPEALAAKLD